VLGYKHLDYLKRCKKMAFWKAGYTQADITKEIGVNQSTISRELNRNIYYLLPRHFGMGIPFIKQANGQTAYWASATETIIK
jgi:hypothetical protein